MVRSMGVVARCSSDRKRMRRSDASSDSLWPSPSSTQVWIAMIICSSNKNVKTFCHADPTTR